MTIKPTDARFTALTEHTDSPFVQEGTVHYLRYDAVSVHHDPATRDGVLLRLWWHGTDVYTFRSHDSTQERPGALITVGMEGRIHVSLA